MGGYVERVQALFEKVLTLPVPTVAAVNGHAFGAGAMLAMAHDWRVMRSDRGYVCFPEVDIRIPFTVGMNALVMAKLTPRAAVDAMTTGRRYAADAAVAAGLVDAVEPARGAPCGGGGRGARPGGQGPRHPRHDQVGHVRRRGHRAAHPRRLRAVVGRPRAHDVDVLLDHARTLWVEQGVSGVTIRALSVETGASNGAIYHAFGSRDGLLVRVWSREAERFLAVQSDAVDTALADRRRPGRRGGRGPGARGVRRP